MEINRTGGQLLIEALQQQGTDHIFCVPGESFLSALDGLHGMESIRTVTVSYTHLTLPTNREV